MRLVTYNIQFSRGKDSRLDLARCIGEVEGADIIALQEVERFWPRSGMLDQPAAIGRLLPGYHWIYGPSFDMHVETGARGAPVDNRRRQFGDMLLSRRPILSSRLFPLPKTHYPDRFNMHMGALEAVVDTARGAWRVWNIHLGYLEAAERREQIRFLSAVQARGPAEAGAWSGPGDIGGDDWTGGGTPPPMPDPTVWLGDFNMLPDSPEYRAVTLLGGGAGLVDAWRAAGAGPGQGPTYLDQPARGNGSGRRIDYCFVTPDLAGGLRRVWVDSAARGSDHQPLWVELDW